MYKITSTSNSRSDLWGAPWGLKHPPQKYASYKGSRSVDYMVEVTGAIASKVVLH